MKTKLVGLGGTELPGSPAEFAKMIAEETAKWSKVVQFANVKLIVERRIRSERQVGIVQAFVVAPASA